MHCWSFLGKANNLGGMKFRDLEDFNLAVFAKNNWKFMQDPTSLVAKVYKSKYFNKESILDAKLGSSSLFIWRSIWMAREVLQECLIWHVGNDKQIKIWGYKWLAKPSNFSVQSPISFLGVEAKVCELIEEDVHQWKEDTIKAHFNEKEATIICNLPINIRGGEDKLTWNWSKNGKFYVWSAYYLLQEKRRKDKGECSNRGKIYEK